MDFFFEENEKSIVKISDIMNFLCLYPSIYSMFFLIFVR